MFPPMARGIIGLILNSLSTQTTLFFDDDSGPGEPAAMGTVALPLGEAGDG